MTRVDVSVLNDRNFNGYLRIRIPHPQDDVVREFIRAYLFASPTDRQQMTSRMTDRAAGVLMKFGQRMGTVAVRARSDEQLRLGLVSMGLAEDRIDDPRAKLYALAVVNHSATEIGTSLESLLDAVRADLSPKALAAFREFAQYDDRVKSLAAFGLAAAGSGEDFRYVYA